MGLFGSWVYDGRAWDDYKPAHLQRGGLWIWVDIHDSDVTTITYHPAPHGRGAAFLGYTPRAYFDDDQIITAADAAAEAAGLADWWALMRGGADSSARSAKAEELVALLAHDETLSRPGGFVEGPTVQLLQVLDVPPPDDLLE